MNSYRPGRKVETNGLVETQWCGGGYCFFFCFVRWLVAGLFVGELFDVHSPSLCAHAEEAYAKKTNTIEKSNFHYLLLIGGYCCKNQRHRKDESFVICLPAHVFNGRPTDDGPHRYVEHFHDSHYKKKNIFKPRTVFRVREWVSLYVFLDAHKMRSQKCNFVSFTTKAKPDCFAQNAGVSKTSLFHTLNRWAFFCFAFRTVVVRLSVYALVPSWYKETGCSRERYDRCYSWDACRVRFQLSTCPVKGGCKRLFFSAESSDQIKDKILGNINESINSWPCFSVVFFLFLGLKS